MKPDTEDILNSIFLIFIVCIIFIWVFKPYIMDKNTQEIFEKATKKYVDDKYTKLYSELCKQSEPDEVNCVMTATSTIYHYTKDQNRSKIRSPSEYAKMGGNCKDSAIFYATIFKRMNYTIEFQFPVPHHVNLIISKKIDEKTYRYCNIEGNTGTCYEVLI
jgi:hypothetical protein